MKAKRYFVSGRVQGVNFRYFVNRTAQVIGVKGYVRNLDDGRVEVFAEGEEALLDQLEQKLKIGPSLAHVTHLEVLEEKPQGFPDFRIAF